MALSGKGRISQDIRNKVLEAADQLEYKKNKPVNNKNWVLILNLDKKEMEICIKEFILNSSPRITALFIHDDMMALKVINILEKLDLNVPEDISIIAPGDTLNYDQIGMPQISTMRIDNSLMGNYATDMMIERIEKGTQNPHVLKIKQTYTDRKSIKKI